MISIIVPVYNLEKYIERCITSVLQQTYTNFELLLVNDGSTDSSLHICQRFAQKDSRIRVLSQENKGVGKARNFGLDQMKGDFIFFLDGDDWVTPDCLEKLMSKMSPDIDLVIGEHQDVTDDGIESPEKTSHKFHDGVLSQKELMHDFYTYQFYTKVVWGKLYRKTLWDALRFEDMIYSEDTYAVLLIFDKLSKAAFVKDPVYFYLQRTTGISRQLSTYKCENFIETLQFMYDHCSEKYPEYKESVAQFYNGYAYILLKKYKKNHQRKPALKLIQRMKAVYRTSGTVNPSFSQKVLCLPKNIVYFLVKAE